MTAVMVRWFVFVNYFNPFIIRVGLRWLFSRIKCRGKLGIKQLDSKKLDALEKTVDGLQIQMMTYLSSSCRFIPTTPTNGDFYRVIIWEILLKKGKGSPYSITERRLPELIPVLGSQPAGDVSHKPGGRLPLLSARPAVTIETLKRAATNFAAWWTKGTMGVNSLPKTVTRQRRSFNLNPGPSVPESSTLTTRLPNHPSASSGTKFSLIRILSRCHCY